MSALLVLSIAIALCGLVLAFIGCVHMLIGRHLPWFAGAAACFALAGYGLAST